MGILLWKARKSWEMQLCNKRAHVRSGSSLSMRSLAIEEAPSPLPALYATLVMNVLAFYSESDRTQARLWTGLSLHCQRRPASAWEGSWTKTGSVSNQIILFCLNVTNGKNIFLLFWCFNQISLTWNGHELRASLIKWRNMKALISISLQH